MSKKDQAAAGTNGRGRGRKAKGGEAARGELAIRVGAHPRARRSIRRVRAQAGIAGFAVTLLLAHQAGVPAFEALLRALAGGMVAHFVTWAFAIALWRRLIVVELEVARARLVERHAQAEVAATARSGSAVGAGLPAA